MIVESMREATRKELIERIKELEQENREIREWKYVIDNPIDLEKLKELDLIKIKGKEYISKDIIKARIKELEEYLYRGSIKDDFSMIRIKAKIQELQSLLEKEFPTTITKEELEKRWEE